MREYIRVKAEKVRLFAQKLHQEARKIALAVVIMEFLIAGSWYLAENKGWLDYFKPKTIIIRAIEPAEAKSIELKQPKSSQYDELMNYIWFKESTNGLNNYSKCELQGKINGIGYGINGSGKYICFENHEEEMNVLNEWLKDKIEDKGLSEAQTLCLYNTGLKLSNCNYIKDLEL